jgi:hypothetical protein
MNVYLSMSILLLTSLSVMASGVQDLTTKMPKEGTASYFALTYIKCLLAKEEEKAISMCDSKMARYLNYDDRSYLKSTIKKLTALDPSKEFTCRIVKTKGNKTKVGFQIHDPNSEYPMSTYVIVLNENGKLYITKSIK